MPTESDERLLELAIEAVEAAARVTQTVQRQIDVDSLTKGDRSPVTAADYASQAVVCHILGTDIPVVGEEDASDLRTTERSFLPQVTQVVNDAGYEADEDTVCDWIDRGGHDGASRQYWTLDPIDGTKGFLRKEQYAISLALIVEGQIRLGVVGCPNLAASGADAASELTDGTLQYATRGGGAFGRTFGDAAPRRLSVSDETTASKIRLCESVESGHSSHSHSARIKTRLGATAEPVRLDSQAKYSVVARGDAEAYLRLPTRPGYQEKIWDHAGGVIVVEEAGGRVSDVDGKPLDFGRGPTLAGNRGVVATAAAVHDVVLKSVAAVLREDAAGSQA